jgi:sucrose-6-phosphatase
MSDRVLLCTDLDRTLIPNGLQPESPAARPLFRAIGARAGFTLAYVSGRDLDLQLDAIDRYRLPLPDFAVADVGTSIYRLGAGERTPWTAWSEDIATDWRDMTGAGLCRLLGEPGPLRLQERQRQKPFKLSYYAPARPVPESTLTELRAVLASHGIDAALIWSIDETRDLGLLDIIPARATKLHAIEFLIRTQGFDRDRTVFAGDSGNDLPVLCSGVPSVLVRNADESVRQAAMELAAAQGHQVSLYLARGGFMGMNGNYAAGILEGLVHFLPETEPWLETARRDHE